MRRSIALLAVLASAAAGGCVSVLPDTGPAPDIYRLSTGPQAATTRLQAQGAEMERLDWGVTVQTPTAPRALATDRIAVVRGGEQISYAADARWSAPAPELIQASVIDAFENDGRLSAAVRPADRVPTRYELRTDMMRFETVYAEPEMTDAPSVALDLRARLIERGSRRLVATRRITTQTPAPENRMGAITETFSRAIDDAARELVDWVIEEGGIAPEGEDSEAQPEPGVTSS
ncbi:MAG: ABC-type transport auxiliary lipoprotein family protein [Maricaulaceae bacterium]|jgi:cholesterol transport system auxiliary component